jgi:hypothetical protein
MRVKEVGRELDLIVLGLQQVGGSCEHSNDRYDSINGGNFWPDQTLSVSDHNSVPWSRTRNYTVCL